MDIDLLSKMVKELILDNDKVVLPGLGSFVAEVVPSTFSDKGYTINPPYRRLSFRTKPDQGDMLVRFYASTNNIDSDVASKIINGFLTELKTLLYTKKIVVFPGLGRLRATKENNLFFVSDEELDIFPEGIGLEPVSLKTHQETDEAVAEAVTELRSILDSSDTVDSPVIAPDPVPVSSPVAATDHAPCSVPVPDYGCAETQCLSDGDDDAEIVHRTVIEENVQERSFIGLTGRIILVFLITALVLLAFFVISAHLFPEIIDSLLYTPEELEILNN